MKHFILSFLIGLMATHVLGQDFERTVLDGEGYKYNCDITIETEIVTLYNQENQYIGIPLVYKDNGEEPPFDLYEKRVEEDGWSHDKAMTIINGAFSLEQKRTVSGREFHIALYVNSTTGQLIDVKFSFPKRYPYSQIPLSVFREIEVKLKEQIYFTLTEAGKKVNYVYLGWMHEVK